MRFAEVFRLHRSTNDYGVHEMVMEGYSAVECPAPLAEMHEQELQRHTGGESLHSFLGVEGE